MSALAELPRKSSLVERAVDVMLTIPPLLQVLKGEKRERLHRAFVGFALEFGSHVMNTEEGRLPLNATEAALQLHRAVLDLAMRAGLSRRDLVEQYNQHAEAASFGNGSVGEAAERAMALLSIFHARKLQGIPE